MDWVNEVKIKLQRKNQVLFDKNSSCLRDLTVLFEKQKHRVMVLWALDFAAGSVARLEEKYPDEKRPWEALEAAWDWASGKIKMRPAQRKILDCHAFAKEISCKEDIAACHAVGQACAVVHTVGHAIGYPIYDLTSLIYRAGTDHCADIVELRKQEYADRLFYWRECSDSYQGSWADFLLKS